MGECFGATIAFLLSRFVLESLFRKCAEKWKIFKSLDRAMVDGTTGLKIALMLRLSTIIPYNVFNMMMGVT